MGEKRIAVIGAGIIGLSSTMHLIANLEKDNIRHVVDVYASEFTPNTTSDGAAGLWEPLLCGSKTPVEQVDRWGRETYTWLRYLRKKEIAGEIGVAQYSGYNLFSAEEFDGDPFWKDSVIGYRRAVPAEWEGIDMNLTVGYYFVSMMVQGNRYCKWLTESLRRRSAIRFYQRKILSLSEFSGKYDLVLNCTGIGSHDLLNDHKVYPVRGQIMKVEAPWIKNFTVAMTEGEIAYVIPCVDHVVIGGTMQDGNWSTESSPIDRASILEKCHRLEPSLKNARIVGEWTGLRPTRQECIRLEREQWNCSATSSPLQVVHNYGHAGGGLSLHWGCAADATDLAYQALGIVRRPSLERDYAYQFLQSDSQFSSRL